jgi:hypothetical protein
VRVSGPEEERPAEDESPSKERRGPIRGHVPPSDKCGLIKSAGSPPLRGGKRFRPPRPFVLGTGGLVVKQSELAQRELGLVGSFADAGENRMEQVCDLEEGFSETSE